MDELPFTMAPEVAAHIEEVLIWATKDKPELLQQAASLVYSFSSSTYPGPHLVIGWYKPEHIDDKFTQFDLFGFKVHIHKTSLQHLEGKHVALERRSDNVRDAVMPVRDSPVPL